MDSCPGIALRVQSHVTNRRQIDSWLWMARHHLRKRRPARSYEAMLSALWLMGVES